MRRLEMICESAISVKWWGQKPWWAVCGGNGLWESDTASMEESFFTDEHLNKDEQNLWGKEELRQNILFLRDYGENLTKPWAVSRWNTVWHFSLLNKVVLEHSHIHVFMYHLWLLSRRMKKLGQRPYGHRTENHYHIALYRKCLATPVLGWGKRNSGKERIKHAMLYGWGRNGNW